MSNQTEVVLATPIPKASDVLMKANFETDARGMGLVLPGDRAKLAWEYSASPDAHILHVFGKRSLDTLKPLPPLERIQKLAELAIDAIYIKANLDLCQQMAAIDERFDEAIRRIDEKADSVLRASRDRLDF